MKYSCVKILSPFKIQFKYQFPHEALSKVCGEGCNISLILYLLLSSLPEMSTTGGTFYHLLYIRH